MYVSLHSASLGRMEGKIDQIVTAVVDGAEQLCHCGLRAGDIDYLTVSGLQCSNQLNQVAFRSKLNGTVTTNASTISISGHPVVSQ